MMDRETLITRSILNDMSSGVMTVDPDGRIGTFNPAASVILGIAGERALGHLLAEVLLVDEGMEDFMQAILDAVYGAEVNQQRVVRITVNGAEKSLALTTSYLRIAEQGRQENLGVIVILNDITQLRELQQAELRLAESLKKQHAELQDAYRKIEENNQVLASTMQRARVATISTACLFLVAGAFAWDISGSPQPARPAAEPVGSREAATLVLRPQPVRKTISLPGMLEPRQEVHITSPISGAVAAVHFQYGDRVEKGQLLLELDLTEVEKQYRQAQTTYIKALKRHQEVEDWANQAEVMRVRRSISKARLALETQKHKVEQTVYLLEQGLIPATEHQAAEQQYQNQLLDFESLESDLESALEKGDADERRVARLELENATVSLDDLRSTLDQGSIRAPVSGVVLLPTASGGQGGTAEDEQLAPGKTISQGNRLLTIGNLEQFSVAGKVDEVNVTQVRVGQRVSVSGEAFLDLRLSGAVAHLSSQADSAGSRSSLPSFDLRVDLEELTGDERLRLRSGMSADMEVVIYDVPDALLVPFSAVRVEDGRTWLRARNGEGGSFRDVEIDVGVTTLDRVEVIGGIEAGAEILVSGTGR